jgi:hypothetical protein
VVNVAAFQKSRRVTLVTNHATPTLTLTLILTSWYGMESHPDDIPCVSPDTLRWISSEYHGG